jgi:hypothetical protein
MMTKKGWLIGLAALVAVAASAGVHFWNVQRPPAPSAAKLPASARALFAPFHKDNLDLRVEAHQEITYRVGMQVGATLVYAWSTSRRGETLFCELPGQKTGRAGEGHGAFEATSSGWYRWRWKNESGHPIEIHVKLNGHYEAASMPYDK